MMYRFERIPDPNRQAQYGDVRFYEIHDLFSLETLKAIYPAWRIEIADRNSLPQGRWQETLHKRTVLIDLTTYFSLGRRASFANFGDQL